MKGLCRRFENERGEDSTGLMAMFADTFSYVLILFSFLQPISLAVSSSCELWKRFYLNGLQKTGDVVLGGLFEVHYSFAYPELTYTSEPPQPTCQG